MIAAVCVHIFFLMDHSNEVLSVLAKLGMAANLPNMLLRWPGCLRSHIVAKECFIIMQNENVRSRDDNED
jgi:hypothetical protein